MRYLSLFSGIEAATAAWGPLGWTCVAVAEIEPFPCGHLAHHLPHAPNLGDVRLITEAQIAALGHIDVIVFGSPCQDLSRGGKQLGFHGDRSSLFFVAMQIVQWARVHCGVRFALWENVRGALTSNGGDDFAAVVGLMAGMAERPGVPPQGWGNEGAALGEALLEWATLDAQWFGVAQRRRRVFCLSDFGDWRSRPPILLERDGHRGDSPPQRRCDGIASPCAARSAGGCECLAAGSWWDGGQVSQTLDAVLYKGQMMPEKNRFPCVLVPASGSMSSTRTCSLSATAATSRSAPNATSTSMSATASAPCRTTPTSTGSATTDSSKLVAARRVLRKLTPIEAERLFGMTDNYTAIGVDGKPAADMPRYKALGNTMAVPVMRWIGLGIEFAARWY